MLSKSNSFVWDEHRQDSFNDTKAFLTSPPVLTSYDIGQLTKLHTDASRIGGLCFLLTQTVDDHDRLVMCGLHYLFSPEPLYSVPDLKLLAVAYASHKCSFLTLGRSDVEVYLDHRPLIQIINSHSLNQIQTPGFGACKKGWTDIA